MSKEITQREREISLLISRGLTSKEIASILHLSSETITSHRTNIMKKTESKNMLESISKLFKSGVLFLFFFCQSGWAQERVFQCMNDDDQQRFMTAKIIPIKKSEMTITVCVGVYVETDSTTVAALGGEENTMNWIRFQFAQADSIYKNEGIQIYLTDVKMVTEHSWSDTLNNIGDVLDVFARVTMNNYNGRFAQFWSVRMSGGRAWIVNPCQTYFESGEFAVGPYSVCLGMSSVQIAYPDYSYNVEVIAHEMGHTMGSPHTHACFWGPDNEALDDCAPPEGVCDLIDTPEFSTIMSYCHLTGNGIDFEVGFGTLPGDLIRGAVMNATCPLECDTSSCEPFMDLTGELFGYYRADSIYLYENVVIADSCILNAKIVYYQMYDSLSTFSLTVDSSATFEIRNFGCPNN